ncbi:MAG: hypothetical protein ACE5JX_22000 [Acidobacteriota bacterium]
MRRKDFFVRPARLIAETSVFNGARGTCFGGTGCCGFVDTWPDPTSIVATTGDADFLKWFGLRCDNNVEVITNFGLFSSSNSSVISVQNGTNHGLAAVDPARAAGCQ